jgi:hypothetical protein
MIAPDRVVAVACDYGGLESAPDGKVFIHITWVPGEDIAHRFQLQKRNPDDMLWKTVYSGSETEFIDVVDAIKHQVIVYRIASWNSIGRSPHEYIKCKPPTTIQNVEANINPPSTNKRPGNHSKNFSFSESFTSSLYGLIKSYLWWVDEVLALVFLIAFPVRFFLYGDANYILRLLRLLPPNMPRRVVVELDLNKSSLTDASVNVSWEKPEDNGVPLVCYCVRWTRMKTEEVKWVKLFQLPLPTTTCIRHLHHGETYKFVVEATNKHGLISRSSRSTYMVPVPELKGKLIPGKSIKAPRVTRNQCYICHDPLNTKKIPFTAALDKKILHFCRICDQEFCHYHKGHVHHTKALSCPAVDGRCVCEKCSLQTNLK